MDRRCRLARVLTRQEGRAVERNGVSGAHLQSGRARRHARDSVAHRGRATFASYYAWEGYALEKAATKTGSAEDYRAVERPYSSCIELDPNYADCYFGLANVYVWTDSEQKAADNYAKAIRHAPTNPMYYGRLARLYATIGGKALPLAEAVLKEADRFATPDDPDPTRRQGATTNHILRAGLAIERGDSTLALEVLERAKAMAPGESPEAVNVLYMLGNTYADLDPPRKQEAVDNLKAFQSRVCASSKKPQYKAECGVVTSRLAALL